MEKNSKKVIEELTDQIFKELLELYLIDTPEAFKEIIRENWLIKAGIPIK